MALARRVRRARTWLTDRDRARYDGPLFISHGEQDAVWGADRTQRLAKRLRAAGRRPEVHIYKGEGHVLLPEAQNTHYLRVVDFFGRALIDGSL